jgi:hypothetical protein
MQKQGVNMAEKKMIKRKDGSYSQQGLWDNIRNKAKENKSKGEKGKEPTKEMLKQEAKIRAAAASGKYKNG